MYFSYSTLLSTSQAAWLLLLSAEGTVEVYEKIVYSDRGETILLYSIPTPSQSLLPLLLITWLE